MDVIVRSFACQEDSSNNCSGNPVGMVARAAASMTRLFGASRMAVAPALPGGLSFLSAILRRPGTLYCA
ncbi:hypothetical protein AT302_14495 [Pandoraea norimbergensis]|uniref:Uncharacterized protein n=1 Tax=Pandoraea norimbergensis TaxID=93219 RepID=A0ABN4JK14_9BURK|nr:hypothetical protein AT302_14495 [Pandoraea norimbergensis]